MKSTLLYYLAAAGVGSLRIIDHDQVELSNLNRQILYDTAAIGRNKAEAAAARLENPGVALPRLWGDLGPAKILLIANGCSCVPQPRPYRSLHRLMLSWTAAADALSRRPR
ncbi:HesA/MoeB/ThiF family protein [Streptosporangium canum]|uniref:HesA/MoeB/ThiF family protein n=1 Tax=Streptosporangium canum TaxID=324952 RepID=UPI0037AEE4BB